MFRMMHYYILNQINENSDLFYEGPYCYSYQHPSLNEKLAQASTECFDPESGKLPQVSCANQIEFFKALNGCKCDNSNRFHKVVNLTSARMDHLPEEQECGQGENAPRLGPLVLAHLLPTWRKMSR